MIQIACTRFIRDFSNLQHPIRIVQFTELNYPIAVEIKGFTDLKPYNQWVIGKFLVKDNLNSPLSENKAGISLSVPWVMLKQAMYGVTKKKKKQAMYGIN